MSRDSDSEMAQGVSLKKNLEEILQIETPI